MIFFLNLFIFNVCHRFYRLDLFDLNWSQQRESSVVVVDCIEHSELDQMQLEVPLDYFDIVAVVAVVAAAVAVVVELVVVDSAVVVVAAAAAVGIAAVAAAGIAVFAAVVVVGIAAGPVVEYYYYLDGIVRSVVVVVVDIVHSFDLALADPDDIVAAVEQGVHFDRPDLDASAVVDCSFDLDEHFDQHVVDTLDLDEPAVAVDIRLVDIRLGIVGPADSDNILVAYLDVVATIGYKNVK